jgi:hypothetical protein
MKLGLTLIFILFTKITIQMLQYSGYLAKNSCSFVIFLLPQTMRFVAIIQ